MLNNSKQCEQEGECIDIFNLRLFKRPNFKYMLPIIEYEKRTQLSFFPLYIQGSSLPLMNLRGARTTYTGTSDSD